MGIRRGSISTPIIADGLVFNMDAANRASYPAQRTFTIAESGSCYNTLDLSISGSFISDPQFITQPISASCWDFDGIDDYIDLPNDSSVFDLPLEHSVGIWCKPLGPGTNSDNAWVFMRGLDNPPYLEWGMAFTANDMTFRTIDGLSKTGFPYITCPDDEVTYGNWYNVVLTVSSTERKIYINGTDSNATDAASAPFTKQSVSSIRTNIGRWGNSTIPRYFEGEIANTTLYNRTLSSTEILHNYNALKGRFA